MKSIHPDDLSLVDGALKNLLENSSPIDIVCRKLTKDGKVYRSRLIAKVVSRSGKNAIASAVILKLDK
ncbi:MAG: PAS domain-containing protein [Clostridiales bacterium]|jgi:hypothetical protein|nr:PAS domain-containing protein [Clostridiales bacterium]